MEKIMLFYDKDSDVLDISLGPPQKARSEEAGNDVIVRKNQDKKIVGFTVLNIMKRGKGFTIPLEAAFVQR
ncbi:MAG: DUF2283 domain-containing protein [Candidatus Aenigmarchaeota archaeon]|nr:DUF2283 domain-containing protein [Candidatus Aenigmarchaeota archaeon]